MRAPQWAGNGAPGENRTHDPLLRRQLLYPTELRAQLSHFAQLSGLNKVFQL
jgi:hypothetical protein